MQVTNIRVSFSRKKQPASYEEAAPFVELTGTLNDGEDHVHMATALLRDAQTIVYAGLGYPLPEKIDAALKAVAEGKTPKAGKTAATPAEDQAQDAAEEPAETPEEPAEAPKKRGRGRPRGSKNTAPKKGTKAAEEAAAKGVAATAKAAEKINDDGLPPEDEEDATDRKISTSPEDRTNPDDDLPPEDGDDLPEEATADTGPADGYTAKDLHREINEAYKNKSLSLANAKSILVHFKVARAQDLTPEQAVEGKAMLDKMLAASA